MKLNTNKCHLLLNSQEPITLKIGDLHINNSLSEKLLGVTFNCKLKFEKQIEDICQKASQKINTLARRALYMGTTKKHTIMNAFFKSRFNYCPLVWMRCNRSLNTKINQLHERCFRIVYNDKKSNFNELPVKVTLSLLRNNHVFFFLFVCSFHFISLYEAICQLLCKVLLVQYLAFPFYEKAIFTVYF